jgi:hypothetical protein
MWRGFERFAVLPYGLTSDIDSWSSWQVAEFASYEEIRQIEEAGDVST